MENRIHDSIGLGYPENQKVAEDVQAMNDSIDNHERHLDSSKEKDKCVLCGIETQYTKDTPIQKRVGYIEGAGQLCPKCYKGVYGGC